jgi:hypothetical protein
LTCRIPPGKPAAFRYLTGREPTDVSFGLAPITAIERGSKIARMPGSVGVLAAAGIDAQLLSRLTEDNTLRCLIIY